MPSRDKLIFSIKLKTVLVNRYSLKTFTFNVETDMVENTL